jgi:uncharacterized protein YqeY
MTLQDQIDEDLKSAMKARQAERLGVLRLLKSAMKYAAIEKHGAEGKLEDQAALGVIRKQVKQRQDAIAGFEKGNRPELAAKEKEEMTMLETYLPRGLSPEELSALVKEAIAESGAVSKAQFGAVMKVAQEKAAGRADGKALSDEIKRVMQ